MPVKTDLALLFCPHCGSDAKIQDYGISSRFRWAVKCSNNLCGCGTPSGLHTRQVAAGIWNRRVERKPPRRVLADLIPSLTPGADRDILRPAKRRSSASGSAAGKSATAPKGAHSRPRSLK